MPNYTHFNKYLEFLNGTTGFDDILDVVIPTGTELTNNIAESPQLDHKENILKHYLFELEGFINLEAEELKSSLIILFQEYIQLECFKYSIDLSKLTNSLRTDFSELGMHPLISLKLEDAQSELELTSLKLSLADRFYLFNCFVEENDPQLLSRNFNLIKNKDKFISLIFDCSLDNAKKLNQGKYPPLRNMDDDRRRFLANLMARWTK